MRNPVERKVVYPVWWVSVCAAWIHRSCYSEWWRGRGRIEGPCVVLIMARHNCSDPTCRAG